MLRKEFRIVLPMTVEEYQTAQLWSTAEASKNETGGGEGVEMVCNEPYEKDGERGQYTKKLYHLESRVPAFVRLLAPKGSLSALEEAWNAYPKCRTEITNPGYMKDNFRVTLQTLHLPDLGTSENVHKLPPNEWKKTEVIKIDIVNDHISRGDYRAEFDPKLFKSHKANRGPFGSHWIEQLKAQKEISDREENNPGAEKTAYMCAYKLVSCKFKWWGLQTRVEALILRQQRRLFTTFHRQVVCWMDNWFGMTMEDIRKLEEETKRDLETMRRTGNIKGMVMEAE
ncbi:phosphatidylinositol transfer protein alpha isoform-like [Clavelina lepadiformis]|uniref:phosphatidylinositol transfer protein alpha isoform-like n=1 Tax=Clavelina lepadiformis TaxID=159417 RepID=UPI004042543D